jgi:hypothetical protein
MAARGQPAAAPTTGAGSLNGSRPNAVYLTRDMQEMAANMGMTNQEYGKHLAQLKKEGKIN